MRNKRSLPAGQQFDTVYDVSETLGLHEEDRLPAGRKPSDDADDPLTGHPGAEGDDGPQ